MLVLDAAGFPPEGDEAAARLIVEAVAGVAAGTQLLVTGASGGVGLAAVQLGIMQLLAVVDASEARGRHEAARARPQKSLRRIAVSGHDLGDPVASLSRIEKSSKPSAADQVSPIFMITARGGRSFFPRSRTLRETIRASASVDTTDRSS